MGLPKHDLSDLCSFLKASVLFQEADNTVINDVASKLEYVTYKKGEPIVLENEPCDHVYFIYVGSAEVVKLQKEQNQLHRVAVLKAGSQFSEFSVLNKTTKAASVFALEDSELFRLNGDTFFSILKSHPLVGKKLVRHLAEMTGHVQASSSKVGYFKESQISFSSVIPQIVPQKLWRQFGVLPLKLENKNLVVAMKDIDNESFYNFIKSSQPNLNLSVVLINDPDFDVFEKN